jgi:hypothetical protein
MVAKMIRRVLVLACGMAVLLPAGPALAQSTPPNDDFGSAMIISALPFTDNADTTGATSASDDPAACGNNGSVWYAFTPSQDEAITASTFGSNYDTVLSAYTGARGALTLVACNDDSSGTVQSQVSFGATAGTTYFFMISQCCGSGGSGGGQHAFNVSAPPPPWTQQWPPSSQASRHPPAPALARRQAASGTSSHRPRAGPFRRALIRPSPTKSRHTQARLSAASRLSGVVPRGSPGF